MSEHRFQKSAPELREMPGQTPVISGYAAIFNRDSNPINGAFIEQVDPGAFNRTLNGSDILGTFNHNPDNVLGRTGNGTMRLYTDDTGLRYEIEVNANDPQAQSILAKVRRGDVQGSSFTFNSIRDEWNFEAEPPQRRLLEVSVPELGPVTMPAYPDTTAGARSAAEKLAPKVGLPVEELALAMSSGAAEFRSVVLNAEDRAVWSSAYMNDLPDSAFLYIESGGSKDSDGKTTPRSLRHFPYKDASGAVDLPHLRNALARIPQSNLSQDVKDTVTAKAQKILAANTDAKNSEPLDGEERVGKTLSAATLEKLQAIHDSLRDLMDSAAGGAPADSDVTDSLEDPDGDEDERDLMDTAKDGAPPDSDVTPLRHLSVVSAGMELRERLNVLDAA